MIWNACLVLAAILSMQLTGSNAQPVSDDKFVNPIAEGADPWVTVNPLAENSDETQPEHFRQRYYWCMSDANRRIAIYTTNDLTQMGKKHVVWQAPKTGPYSREIWAPELHFVDGHWYVYVAASDGDNANHLAYVLKSKTDDVLSEYEVHGPLETGDGEDGRSPNVWAIDMTLLRHNEKLYAIWSGWDAPGTDRQFLYIAPMSSPTELSGPRVRLCANDDYLWERLEPALEHRGLNEGPEVFQANGRTFVFYSCGASWLPTYKLGRLELKGDDPLDPNAWVKSDQPAFESSDDVYGVGHSCFVPSPDGTQWWHVYHAKRDRNPGWRRAVHVQPMQVDDAGMPELGKPLSPAEALELPSGTRTANPSSSDESGFSFPSLDQASYSFYGHHQFMHQDSAGLVLGQVPTDPVNDYRSGEKVVFSQSVPENFEAAVTIDFLDGSASRDAGILFRCSRASVGFDSQQAYFAGIVPKTQLVILGKTDGRNWVELKRAQVQLNPGVKNDADADQANSASLRCRLGVVAKGSRLRVLLDGRQVISADDSSYRHGQLGLRVVDSCARFTELEVKSVQ